MSAVNDRFSQQNKRRGISLLPVPRIEAFAMPSTVERATSKPTPICIHLSQYGYKTPCIAQCAIPVKGCEYITSRGHLLLPCSRLYWKLRSFDSSRTKRQVNAFILCRDTFIPLTFSPILTLGSRLKRLQMPRHGVSECSIGCKDNEKNDYSRIFSWLFFVGRIKTDVWAHKEDLLHPNTQSF